MMSSRPAPPYVAAAAALAVMVVMMMGAHLAEAYPELTEYDKSRQEVAQEMVDNAIAAFDADPRSAMDQIQDLDNIVYHDGELYVFVLDGNMTMVAHGATPDLVGTSLYDLTDTQDTNLGELFEENRSPYGRWVEYYWPNPATESDESELKLTWAKVRSGHVFAVGIYPEFSEEEVSIAQLSGADGERQRIAADMVDQAAAAFSADRESAILAIQDPGNDLYHDGELYVFVLDGNMTMVAHGATPDLVGTSLYDLTDTQDTNLGELFEENRSPYGRWVEYYWPNPATESDESELKLTWAKARSGHVFAVGIYPGFSAGMNAVVSDADAERQRVVKEMVDRAIEAFAADAESAMAAIQDPGNDLYHDGELYVFVLDGNMTMVAHGATPDLVGTSLYDLTDTQDTNLGELFEESRSPYGKWVGYYWPNPATESDESELKMTWTKARSGYVFNVGIYPGFAEGLRTQIDEEDRHRQETAVAMTEQAIEAFAADAESAMAAMQDPDNDLYHDGELYVAVIDVATSVIVTHGTIPDRVGTSMYDLVDKQDTNLGELFAVNMSPYGRWVEYYGPNPATESDESELKVSWIKVSGKYAFVVGIYPG